MKRNPFIFIIFLCFALARPMAIKAAPYYEELKAEAMKSGTEIQYTTGKEIEKTIQMLL